MRRWSIPLGKFQKCISSATPWIHRIWSSNIEPGTLHSFPSPWHFCFFLPILMIWYLNQTYILHVSFSFFFFPHMVFLIELSSSHFCNNPRGAGLAQAYTLHDAKLTHSWQHVESYASTTVALTMVINQLDTFVKAQAVQSWQRASKSGLLHVSKLCDLGHSLQVSVSSFVKWEWQENRFCRAAERLKEDIHSKAEGFKEIIRC